MGSPPHYAWLVDVRRRLHRIPELAFEERKTAALVLDELRGLGIPAEYPGPGGGVVARLVGADPSGPTVALRAELDALPGKETTGLPFRSEHEGMVHACGHDAHMTMVLGAARLLAHEPPKGNVVFVFQPAEERGGGARTVIDAGCLQGVRAIFAAHVAPHYTTGTIMVSTGTITARSDTFRIDVRGKSGHGARPHEAVDAIAVTGFLINAIGSLVSRRLNPAHPTVLTIGRVQGGTASNVIAGEAFLEGSIRTTTRDARAHVIEGLERLAQSANTLHGAVVEVSVREGYPSVINTPLETALARDAAVEVFGSSHVVEQEHPSLGSEDFSFFLQRVPGCYVRVGVRHPDWEYVPLHSPGFNVDEAALPLGARFFDRLVRRAIARYRDEV